MEPETKKENRGFVSEDLKDLVIARLDAMLPPDRKISIGSIDEEFTKTDLIGHVRDEDEIGRKVVDLEMTFLRALKDGELLREVLAGGE